MVESICAVGAGATEATNAGLRKIMSESEFYTNQAKLNAFIGYGIHLGVSGKDFKWPGIGVHATWADLYAYNKAGIDLEPDASRKEVNRLWDKIGIRIEHGESTDDLYLFIEETANWAALDNPKIIDPVKYKPKTKWDTRLKDFCDTMRLPYSKPQWIIFANLTP